MDKVIIGIDVSKDRLDVAVRPGGEAFVVERNAGGLDALIARLKPLAPHIVAFGKRRAVSRPSSRQPWARLVCRSPSSTRRRSAPSPRRSASAPKPIGSMPR